MNIENTKILYPHKIHVVNEFISMLKFVSYDKILQFINNKLLTILLK